jgi:hypothetical protein
MTDAPEDLPAANPARGEARVSLRGEGGGRVNILLRPTWGRIVAIEEETGRGIVEVARELLTGEPSFRTCLAVLRRAQHPDGHRSVETLGALLLANGVQDTELLRGLSTVALAAINGDRRTPGGTGAGDDPGKATADG